MRIISRCRFKEGIICIGLRGDSCKIKEEFWDEVMVTVETREEMEDLESVESEDRTTVGPRVETREVWYLNDFEQWCLLKCDCTRLSYESKKETKVRNDISLMTKATVQLEF